MNKIVSKFLFAGDKFMPKLLDLLIAIVDRLLNIVKGLTSSKETGDLNYICNNELDKLVYSTIRNCSNRPRVSIELLTSEICSKNEK